MMCMMLHLTVNWEQHMLTDYRIDNMLLCKQRIDISVYCYAYQPLWRFSFLICERLMLCVEQSDAKICFAWTGQCFSSVVNSELRTNNDHLLLWI